MKLFVCLALVLAGCDASTPDEPLTDTIVILNGDLPPTVTVRATTADERERELAARLATPAAGVRQEGISVDPSCAGSSLWLYNKLVANQSTAQRICFQGTGTTSLANYSLGGGGADLASCTSGDLGCPTWDNAVKSYWPGINPGTLKEFTGSACTINFNPGDPNSDVKSGCRNQLDLVILVN